MNNNLYRDSFVLSLSKGTSVLLTMVTGFLIARNLDVADFGKFAAVLAFGQILAVLVDPGMGQIAAKLIARNFSQGFLIANQIFSWRILLVAAASVLAPLIAHLIFSSQTIKILALFLVPAIMVSGFTDFFDWIFKGAQRIIWGVYLQLAARSLLLVFCWIALKQASPLASLTLAYWGVALFSIIFGIALIGRRLQSLHFQFPSKEFFKKVAPDIYKLGLIIMIGMASVRLDILLVNKFCGDTSAGLFSAGGRIVDGLREVIPMVVFSTHVPAFAAESSLPILRKKFRVAMVFLVGCSILLAVVGTLFAEPLFVHLFGPSYQPGAVYFRPLIWSNVFMFPNMLMFATLYALNDHKTPAMAMGASCLVGLLINFLFLPHFGVVVAAWSRLIAEGVNFIVQGWGLVRQRIISVQELFMGDRQPNLSTNRESHDRH